MKQFEAKVKESSWEMSAREKIKYKDTANFDSLYDLVIMDGTPVTIDVANWVMVDIHNEKSDTVDYEKLVIIDKNGSAYYTGSESFVRAFMDIYEEMTDAGETDIEIEVISRQSNNYNGKEFLTCVLK